MAQQISTAAGKRGFGNETGNWWIGMEKLHSLAGQGKGAILNITMKMKEDGEKTRNVQYSLFEIRNEKDGYRLQVGGFAGNVYDALAYHNMSQFSTYDKDNDGDSRNCARILKGGWWYIDCYYCVLNSLYPIYMHWHSSTITYSEIKIKIKQ